MPVASLLTISATSRRFNVKHSTIHRWITGNKIKPVIIDGKYFFNPVEIENMTKKGAKT